MLQPRPAKYKLYVIFKFSPRLMWLDHHLNHAYVIKETEDYWVKTEKYWSHLDSEVYPVDGNPHIRCLVNDADVVVPVEVNIKPSKTPISLGLMTCVSVVKAQLGLRKFWILTPRQLYNYLTKGEK